MTMTPNIRLPKAATAIARANRASSHTNNTNLRCLSSAPSNRQSDNEAWWSLSSLHKRVATIIATSLPNESLSVVHKSLSEKLNEADSHKSVSINEAIVSARARDAHHQTLNGGIVNGNTSSPSVEKQKQLEKEIEQRALEKAQERMQLELEAMKQQMQRKEEQRIQKEREEHERELAFERWKENAAREQQQLKVEDVKQQEATSNNNAHHPILGPQIAHLPYKRIHLTSAATLASLPVYEKQRAYRHDRATNMAKDKKKTLWMGIPGVISLMEEEDGRLSILDGQHRVGMMALLEEEQRKIREKGNDTGNHELAKLDLENILVEVFFPRQSSSDSDSESVLASSSQKQTPEQQQQNDDKAVIFTEINKAEPVKLLDLPGVAPKRTRDMIDHAASHFYNTYPAMFSPSTRCRAVSRELSFVASCSSRCIYISYTHRFPYSHT